ncbi:Protoporphyrinogen oxidase [Arthrobacter sp. Bi83]|uniref:protoporphyrinogen oxidase n=1 Tax=Arthrobacter sp. Bi83 TaxID=2822353 RepID=UPI001DE0FE9C|nr:protoporphyrinogen oxidase [Arthrobacter sp. Bi83]CAH0229548.1 Protoporphyrinogen oxidase [Arthrobacter sp. Bi83]
MGAGSSPVAGRTALVVGGGISGLLAARELAQAGLDTTLLEATDSWGGCVGRHEVAGLDLDSGAESFATRSSAVADLATELGLTKDIVAPHPGGAWVQLPDGPRELPKTGVLGIPANPWDPEVRRSLGLGGSLRASLDRFLPASVGTTADVASVSSLVRARMGRRVLTRLVEPVVGGVHSADPGLLDVDMVAPGLRAGITRHGSLAAAVAAQRRRPAEGAAAAKAGSAVAGLRGGMHTLVSALVADLRRRGVGLVTGARADSAARTPDGWRIRTSGTGTPEDGANGQTYDAGVLVIALDGPAAVGLLEDAVPALAGHRPGPGPEVKLVTLVVDLPELDRRPRGTGILVAPQTPGIRAKALTHATAKWDWLAAAAGPGRHVLRLSYGRRDSAAPAADTPELSADAALLEQAMRDASALLTVPVSADSLVDWDVVSWAGALPFAAVGHRQRVAEVRRICAGSEGLLLVGGWLAGNGLAAVVADTRKQLQDVLH